MRSGATTSKKLIAVIVLLCALTLALAYFNKARCAGSPYYDNGRSIIFDQKKDSNVCYSDIQFLWLGRDIDKHVFPYVDGGINGNGDLVGGSVEYPVLSGALMWIGAIGAHTDAQFLFDSALLLAPFALLTAWMLGRMAGRAALLWAIGSPLVLYAFHNWELPVVLTAVAAIYLVTMVQRIPLRTRAIGAAVLLGIGFCLKLYPGAFVVPLAAFVLTGGIGGRELPSTVKGRYDIRGAIAVAVAAVVTVVAINVPFAVAGFTGWRASFTFQQNREADITTNSIWYWGLRPMFGPDPASEAAFQHAVSIASPVLVLASFALAVWLGWRKFGTTGSYPWVAVSGAMLCGFLLFHKVHSPQYTLWLVPFLVLLIVSWPAIFGYLLADAAIGIGVFLYFHALSSGGPADWQENVVQFGVWGRAVLLVFFFFAFLRAGQKSAVKSTEPATLPGALVQSGSTA
ncbi:glycosyltransferase 87 family protein [Antrihabitans cavernicola]|uniref:DUF2029 domain-containing protein n=1 Tax=Antrihabitans cavernicola TaxID=2495913 RepID=A0A5A7S5M5_9NOCA|nr:glycosyltransferase 87 family protein [Spelaeibacter cavernicola]KAA0018482.1 DUF2029 domain-containing protein [Spelaeibacter cavernicola]